MCRVQTLRVMLCSSGKQSTGKWVSVLKKKDTHLQGTKNVTIRVYTGNYMHHCICNIR